MLISFSLRAQFGTDIKANAIHGSSTSHHAIESMKLIFGDLEFNPDGTVKGILINTIIAAASVNSFTFSGGTLDFLDIGE